MLNLHAIRTTLPEALFILQYAWNKQILGNLSFVILAFTPDYVSRLCGHVCKSESLAVGKAFQSDEMAMGRE